MGKVVVDKIYSRKKHGLLPTMVAFENGKIVALKKANTHFCRLIDKQNAKQVTALLTINTNMYQGIINDGQTNELTDTYICVRNKNSNSITMIPVDQVRLKNYTFTKPSEIAKSAVPQELATKTMLEKFGNRKASRLANDKERLKINIQSMQQDLQQTVDESNLADNEEESIDDKNYYNKIRPPFNPETNVLSNVYKAEDILSKDLLNKLEEEAKTIYQTKIEQIPIKSAYLLQKITKLQESIPGVETFLHIKLIIYMDALLNLINSRTKSLEKIELSQITEKVEYNIRENFTDPKGGYKGARTSFSNEKAMCYFIVLALMIESNYQVDGKILSQELHAPRNKILTFAHIVNALPKSKTSTMLTLHLPNNVPPVPTRSKSKRK